MADHASAGVFISYRREDASGHAGRLYDYLAASLGKGRVFMDVDAIAPGADFVERIDSALSRSLAMFVVIGPRWGAATDRAGRSRLEDPRDVVRREIAAALVQGILVIPVLVGGAVMPGEEDLPEDLKGLATRNAVQLDDTRWSSDVDRLLAAIPAGGGVGAESRSQRLNVMTLAPSAFWLIFGILSAVAILALFLGVVAEKFPRLVGLPEMPEMATSANDVQIFEDLIFSGFNLFLGLSLAWLAADDRTVRWLAFGMVGTAAAFNLSAHHVFGAAAGTALFPAGTIHILFHLTVAGGYAYALMLFPDGKLPPAPAWMRSVLAAVALLVMVLAFVLYPRSEGWVILYFGTVVVIAGGLALLFKARYLPSPFERERASGYFGAYITGAIVTAAFVALSLAIHLHGRWPPDALRGEAFTSDVVGSLTPVLTAIPIVLLIGLIRDRLWGTEDVANRSALYGVLVVVLLASFMSVDLVIHTLATSAVGDGVFIGLAALVIIVLALEHPRERVVQAWRRLVYGIDSDPDLAMRNLSERLTASVSSDDILSALADVTRRSIGVSAGELEVRWPDGTVNSGAWPDGVREPGMQPIGLRSHGDPLGSVAVRKVTRLRLTKKEHEMVEALATAAALAMRARNTPAHA